jgi:arylsulfatase
VFSADDGLDVGEDSGAPVSPDYGPTKNSFNRKIRGLLFEIGEGAENADHLVKPEQALAVAMGRE